MKTAVKTLVKNCVKINLNISGHESVPKNIHTVFHTVFHADFHCNLGVTHKIIHTIFHTVVAGSCFTPVLTATFGATHFNHSVCTLGSWGDSCGSTNHLVCPQDLLWIRQNPCGPTRLGSTNILCTQGFLWIQKNPCCGPTSSQVPWDPEEVD